jgi:hypothetical protein
MAGSTTIRYGKATIRLEGFTELFAYLNRVGGNAREAAIEVFNAGTQRVYAASQSIVPVSPEDGGQLKASGRVSKARVSKKDVVTASVNYGGTVLARLAPGDNPLYGIVQHEDLSAKHSHGEAKFLEKPMVAQRELIMNELKVRIAAKLGAK